MSADESSAVHGEKFETGRVKVKETRRTISPYDLTPSDNPGGIISYPLLDGKNYDEWALGFKTALCSRKKFGFLDGSIPKPDEGSADYDDWIPINALLISWIKMTIHESLRPSISHREIAKDLWDSLKKRFSISNGPRFQQLKADISMCKQHGQPVENYYSRLCKIWDALDVLQPKRRCTCGRCLCDVFDLIDKDKEDDRVQQFLYGLDDNLQSIRSSLVSRRPLPSLEEAYNLLRQEEDIQLQGKKNSERHDVMALAVGTKFNGTGREDKSKLFCTHCKRNGHDSGHCFTIVGYPEWWGDRSRKPPPYNKRDKTGEKGPATYQSRSTNEKGTGTFQSRATANIASTTTTLTPTPQLLSASDRNSVLGLSDEQWTKVVTLINAGTTTASEQLTGPHFEDGDWSW